MTRRLVVSIGVKEHGGAATCARIAVADYRSGPGGREVMQPVFVLAPRATPERPNPPEWVLTSLDWGGW